MATASGGPGNAAADGVDFFALLGLACILGSLLWGSAWLASDLPGIVKELWRLMDDWAATHEVTRQVDCGPWGLQRKFTIAQDHATTTPASNAICSWAAGPGRKWEFGLSLWNGALALSRLLVQRRADLAAGAFGPGRSVVELGCGQALVSMVVIELFPHLRRVLATDGSEEVLRAAGANVVANLGAAAAGRVELAPLRWGCPEDVRGALELNGGSCYDVVLGADITYAEEWEEPLVEAVAGLSHAGTEVWITHEPRRRSTEGLVQRLRASFATVEESTLPMAPSDLGRGEHVDILVWRCTGKLPR